MRFAILFPIWAVLLGGFGAMGKNVYAQADQQILATGNPPLTQLDVDKTVALLKWALEIPIASDHKLKLQKVIVRAWQTKNQLEMESTINMVAIHDQLMAMPETERNARRGVLRSAILENLRRETDDEMSRILVSVYDAARSSKPSATSSGPLLNTPETDRGRVGADGFTGIYRMLRPKALNINNSGFESGYWIEYITFLPNGNAYWSLPPEGLLDFDPALTAKTDPDDWGTYSIKNGDIHVLRGPSKTLYVITRSGERLNNPPSLGKGTFRPVPAADGLRIEGRFRRDPSEPALEFTKDGTFRDGGVFRYFGTLVRPDGSHYQDDGVPGYGTYRIEQNTLELRYSDGRVKRHPFIAFPESLAKKPAIDRFILRREEGFTRF